MADVCFCVSFTVFTGNCFTDYNSVEFLKHKECYNLSYDGQLVKWLWSLDLFKKFVEFDMKLHVVWT